MTWFRRLVRPADDSVVGRALNDSGVVAVLVAVLAMVLLALTALAIDVGRWYVEAQRVQKAADSAAMAGVTWLPANCTQAKATAVSIAGLNGYPDAARITSECLGSKLKVTVSGTVGNAFGAIFAQNGETTVSRSALADYQADALLGSPCNAFGNQPSSTTGSQLPVGSVIPNDSGQGGFTTCQGSPGFWGLIEGPNEPKVNGDRYATRTCTSPSYCGLGTAATTNKEYRIENYFWTVHVEPAAIGKPVRLQLYDPGVVNTGSTCNRLSSATFSNQTSPSMNSFMDGSTAAPSERYSATSNAYCTGDAGSTPANTSFALRQTDDSYNALDAPVQNGIDGLPCIKQFRGYNPNTGDFDNLLTQSDGNYDRDFSQIFHQWTALCTFQPTRAGDYYLQVRTNVALGGTFIANTNGHAAGIYSGNTAVLNQAETETNTNGINGFAIRAAVCTTPSGSCTMDPAASVAVAVSGRASMPIWVNVSNQTATFNLIRILPNAAGKSFTFTVFDPNDANASGTIQVLPPVVLSGQPAFTLSGCTESGPTGFNGVPPAEQAAANCTVTVSQSTHQGRLQAITVPIPGNYTCASDSLGGCWFRVLYDYGTGSVNDVTTWDLKINGNPIRLLE